MDLYSFWGNQIRGGGGGNLWPLLEEGGNVRSPTPLVNYTVEMEHILPRSSYRGRSTAPLTHLTKLTSRLLVVAGMMIKEDPLGSDPNIFAVKIPAKYNPINFDNISIKMVLPTKKRKARQEEEEIPVHQRLLELEVLYSL